jgi:REP element-mobilizing transposase RayT
VQPPPLSRVIQWFKTMTTNEYFRGVREVGWPAVPGKLWQRNYYEHIVRSPRAGRLIATYILENPSHWLTDVENPNAEESSPDRIREIIETDR